MKTPIIECVPNISEGHHSNSILAFQEAVKSVADVKLLHTDTGYSANRTVLTYAGSPEAVFKATEKLFKVVKELVDMTTHKGEHPRIGAIDVCPFIPVSGISMPELLPLVDAFAKKMAEKYNVPIYLYEDSTQIALRKNLANIRRGEYEGLEKKLLQKEWKPDYGPTDFQPKWGATALGARDFLLAYNINLSTQNPKVAAEIAALIRESGPGKHIIESDYSPLYLPEIKAIGWYIPEFSKSQVSINIRNYRITPLHVVFESVKKFAHLLDTKVTGSELIGMAPLEAFTISGNFYAQNNKLTPEQLINIVVERLGLNDLYAFDPNEKVLEYRMQFVST